MPESPVSDTASAALAAPDEAELPTSVRPAPPEQPAPIRRPALTARPRPPMPPQGDQADQPRERVTPLQAQLRRRPLGGAVHFDTPGGSDRIVRPPQFNNGGALTGPRTSPVPGTPARARVVPAPGVPWNLESDRTPDLAPAPVNHAPDLGADPLAPGAGAAEAQSATTSPTTSPTGPTTGPPPPNATPRRPENAGGLDAGSPRPTAAPAAPVAGSTGPVPQYRTPRPSSAEGGPVRPSGGTGRPAALGTPSSSISGLPDALKPYAPGAPNIQMEMAAMNLSPRWNPGDDDVMPTDGHKGPRRPRLRDRLPW